MLIDLFEIDGHHDVSTQSIRITGRTSNDGYFEWQVPDNIMERLSDTINFPEFKVKINYSDGRWWCGSWSSEFRIAYNFLDFSTGYGDVTVFEADEVELFGGGASASIELSMGMSGSATAFTYMRTGNYNPAEQVLAYADVNVHAPMDTEVRIDAELYWESEEAVLPVPGRDRAGWSDMPGLVWGLRLFGKSALVGLRIRAFHQLRIGVDTQLVIPLEKQMDLSARACYTWEPSKGAQKVGGSYYNRDFAIDGAESENKDAGGWSFSVQGEVEVALRPELALGIWLDDGGRKAIVYLSVDGIITASLKFWAEVGSAPLVLPAEFAGDNVLGVPNSNCRPNHSVALGIYIGFEGTSVVFQVRLRTGFSFADRYIDDPLLNLVSPRFLGWQNDQYLFGSCFLERTFNPPPLPLPPPSLPSPPPSPSLLTPPSPPPPSPPPPPPSLPLPPSPSPPPPPSLPLCAALTVITTSAGNFSDSPDGNSDTYVSNSECAWALQPSNGEFLHLVRAPIMPSPFGPCVCRRRAFRTVEHPTLCARLYYQGAIGRLRIVARVRCMYDGPRQTLTLHTSEAFEKRGRESTFSSASWLVHVFSNKSRGFHVVTRTVLV